MDTRARALTFPLSVVFWLKDIIFTGINLEREVDNAQSYPNSQCKLSRVPLS